MFQPCRIRSPEEDSIVTHVNEKVIIGATSDHAMRRATATFSSQLDNSAHARLRSRPGSQRKAVVLVAYRSWSRKSRKGSATMTPDDELNIGQYGCTSGGKSAGCVGTFETCRRAPRMSGVGGRPEVAVGGHTDAIDHFGHAELIGNGKRWLFWYSFVCEGLIASPSS